MNELQTFTNSKFGSVRTVTIDNDVWFVGKDVATALGYAKPENAISNHVDAEDKTTTLIQGTGSNYKSKAVIINESGLYALILSSKLPTAREFKHWVTSEVLPTIKRHGAYLTPEAAYRAITDPDFIINLATQLKAERRKNDKLASENQQLAAAVEEKNRYLGAYENELEFAYNAIEYKRWELENRKSINVNTFAKILKSNGIDIGPQRLFKWLHEHGYLMNQPWARNIPTQKAMNSSLLELKHCTIKHNDGTLTERYTPYITFVGQAKLAAKIRSEQQQTIFDEMNKEVKI